MKYFPLRSLCLAALVLCAVCAVAAQDYPVSIVVAQDGSGDYTQIQAAIDNAKAFPDKRIVIHIKPGVYREKVKVHAWNTRLSLVGEDARSTLITYDDYFDKLKKGRNSTFFTPTLLVQGDDCEIVNLTIENSAGPVGQAVALALEADACTVRNCRVLGHQDTFYAAGARGARAYITHSYIEGTTDFIFGPATALFEDCEIRSKSNSFITAASTPKGAKHGFVFLRCRLSAAPGVDSVFLGRPWRDYAKTAFIRCDMGAHILPAGWSNWQGTQRDKTAYFAEYGNTGPGADTKRRVAWMRRLSAAGAARCQPRKVLGVWPD